MSPTYLFECETCKARLEQFQKHDDPNPSCAECGLPTRRLIAGGTDFILRGSGWTGKHYMSPRVGTKPRKKPAP